MMDGIKTVGVIGLGVMGFDIAFLYARTGYRTIVYDAAEAAMMGLPARRDQTIERLKRRNRISDRQGADVMTGMIPASGLSALVEADLVTEAVSESGRTKKLVYKALRESGFDGILTTNTSSLTRTSLIGDGTYGGDRFATTHFFNPVLYTQMVEVVRGDMSEENFTKLMRFLSDLGRKAIETKDISGFVSNSVLMVYAVMALRLVEAGVSIEEVDAAARALGALPPLFSFDSWKPSIVADVTTVMHEFRGEEFLRSSRLLSALRNNPVFYKDQKGNATIYDLVPYRGAGVSPEMIKLALMTAVRIAAARTVELGEGPATVDFISIEGLKFPRGPLAEIDELGAAKVLDDLGQVNDAISDGLSKPRLLHAMAEQKQTFFKGGQPNPWLQTFLRSSDASH